MLIKFVVENFLSFKEETVFDLAATSDKKHPDHVNQADQLSPSLNILKIAAIYGANASGKSNLISAIEFARDLIISGTRGDDTLSTKPFKLDAEYSDKPSKFQFIFYFKGKVYDYGFWLDKNKIHQEWLYVKSKRNYMKMFERITTNSDENEYEFGNSFVNKRSKKKYQRYEYEIQGTRVNQLFLTEAFNRKVDEVKPVIHWFKDILVILSPNSRHSTLELRAQQDKKFNNFLCELLKIADTGIENVSTDIEYIDFDKQFRDMPDNLIKTIKDRLKHDEVTLIFDGEKQYTISKDADGNATNVKLNMQHKGSCNAELADFKLEEESEGTQRLIHLAPALADLLENEKVYLIDELDRKLHPNLTKSLIDLYINVHIPKANRQLVFITHESNLLNLEHFRRDEIWFVEKDNKGESHVCSLADFKIRPDLNIKTGYLNGRFGAIPFIGDIKKLGWLD